MRLTMYAAATQLYRGAPPVTEYIRFASQTSNATLANDNRRLSNNGGGGIALCLSDSPVVGKVYLEFLAASVDGSYTGPSAYGGTETNPAAFPTSDSWGWWFGQPGFDFAFSQWTVLWGANGGGDGGSEGGAGTAPVTYRAKLAIDAATRRFWIRYNSNGWWGGGDPAANTSPTFTLGGSSPIRVGGSVDPGSSYLDLLVPADYESVAPAGFTAGIVVT